MFLFSLIAVKFFIQVAMLDWPAVFGSRAEEIGLSLDEVARLDALSLDTFWKFPSRATTYRGMQLSSCGWFAKIFVAL